MAGQDRYRDGQKRYAKNRLDCCAHGSAGLQRVKVSGNRRKIASRSMRRLVMTHAIRAFLFHIAVLTLGINIIASVI